MWTLGEKEFGFFPVYKGGVLTRSLDFWGGGRPKRRGMGNSNRGGCKNQGGIPRLICGEAENSNGFRAVKGAGRKRTGAICAGTKDSEKSKH